MSRRGWVGMRWAGFCLVAVIVTATQATPAGAKTHGNAKISPPLLALAAAKPKNDFSVIVRASSKRNNGHHAERAAAAVKRANGKVGRDLSIVGGASARLSGAAVLALADDPDVAYVGLDEVVTATFDPLDGAALASSPGIVEVGAPEVWRQLGVTGRGIGVAILDSGIAPHPDLAGRIVAAVDFTGGNTTADLVPPADPGGHGTHVAGLVAGDGAASGGAYTGVAPGASLIDVRVIGASGSTNVSTLIAGMQWVLAHRADYNIRVVNLSAGGPATTSYRDDPLAIAAEVLVFSGITVVVSAGNEGPHERTITSPGTDPYVITVGGIDDSGTATTADDALASWSSRGVTPIDGLAKPDVVAPGRKVVSLRSLGSTLDQELPDRLVAGLDPLVPAYFRLSGTSMAAPVVTGVVALMLEHSPALTPGQVKARLKTTATVLPYGSAETTGSGMVSAVAAVASSDQSAGAASDQTASAAAPSDQTAGAAAAPDPVSGGFAGELYRLLYGQPLTWRHLAFNGGVDSNGVPWSEVTWSNVVWDAVTWQNLNWGSFNWSAVNWQDISWEDISWEGITWEDISWEVVPVNDKEKGRKGHRGGKVIN